MEENSTYVLSYDRILQIWTIIQSIWVNSIFPTIVSFEKRYKLTLYVQVGINMSFTDGYNDNVYTFICSDGKSWESWISSESNRFRSKLSVYVMLSYCCEDWTPKTWLVVQYAKHWTYESEMSVFFGYIYIYIYIAWGDNLSEIGVLLPLHYWLLRHKLILTI